MDPVVALILIVFLMLGLIFIGVPIAFAMALSGVLGIIGLQGVPTAIYTLGSFPVTRLNSYNLAVIPLFVFMGQLAFSSGIASDAYSLAYKWLGRLKGGLMITTIGACGIFAATTGSTTASVASMGKVAIPEMRKYGYDVRLAAGGTAAAGTIAALIPPSVSLVIYGIATYESIGKLFLAGILPGILSVLIYMIMVYTRVSINPQLASPSEERFSLKHKILSLGKAWGAILIFVVVIGGLYTGIATPTEVGALGTGAALLIMLVTVIQGRTKWTAFGEAVLETVKVVAMVFAFIIGAGLFSLFITMSGVVPLLVAAVGELAMPRIFIFIAIAILYIPLGMFFDPLSMILVTIPITYPIVVGTLGYSSIWFGIILVKLIELSLITPPMGMSLYVIKGLFPDVSLKDILYGSLWFMVMDLVTIAILVAFPSICTWLPSLMR